MKSYDDLQRFKEKTQTNHIEFKDMSEQTRNSDSANWAIIKQLMDEGAESALGNGQSVHVAAPQRVTDELFSRPATSSAPQVVPSPPQSIPHSQQQPANVAAFVAAKPAVQPGGSLLDSISASLKPVQAAEQPQPAAIAEPSPVVNPLDAPPVQAASAEQPRFKQLFSSAPEQPDGSLSKGTLLQPLLERIASCR
ncbi:cellulose biosynthesis protein BcsO [Erwinia amylovora]